jgi:hypothetical protein
MAESDTVEIMVCADTDDQETLDLLKTPAFAAPGVKQFVLDRTHIRDKYGVMEREATGRMLYYWSDDVFMLTKSWDLSTRLFYQAHPHKKFICSFKDDIWNGDMGINKPAGPFFLTREWVDAIGHTINPKLKWQAIDLWLWDVGRRATMLGGKDDDLGTTRKAAYREYLSTVHAHHAHHERPRDATDEAAVPDYQPAVKQIYDTREGEAERQAEALRLVGGK